MTLTNSLDQASSTIQDAGHRIESLQSALTYTKNDLIKSQEELTRLALLLDNYVAATEAGHPVEGNQLRLMGLPRLQLTSGVERFRPRVRSG